MMRRRKNKPQPSLQPSPSSSKSPPPNTTPKPSSSSLPIYQSFLLLLLTRLIAALTHPIADCDETFNYWEPLHYLLFSFGFQTWEYSPEFALRSYTYLLPPALIARISLLFHPSKLIAFYAIRCVQALVSTIAEIYLCTSAVTVFGPDVARLLFWFLLTSPGVLRSAVELLPSSFAMITLTLAFASWMQARIFHAVAFVALASLLGWVFAAALAIPLALDILLRKNGLSTFIRYAVLSGVPIIAVMAAVDSYYFGSLVIAPLHHVLYNVFPKEGAGSHLYGVEQTSFYIFNLVLNTNVASLLLMLFPVLCFVLLAFSIARKRLHPVLTWHKLRFLLPTYLWLIIFFNQPHKEERFLAPCYTLIPLIAAVTFSEGLQLCADTLMLLLRVKRQDSDHASSAGRSALKSLPSIFKVMTTIILVFILLTLGASRTIMQVLAFRAPLALFRHLSQEELQNGIGPKQGPAEFASPTRDINICIGKEWYRFPTNFFIPARRFRIRFIKSGFKGLLPKPFSEENFASRVIPDGMNEFNREDPEQYYDWERNEGCHYFVDLDLSHRQSPGEDPQYQSPTDQNSRAVVFSQPFLDSEESEKGFRSFFIPGYEHKLAFGEYHLIRNVELLPYT